MQVPIQLRRSRRISRKARLPALLLIFLLGGLALSGAIGVWRRREASKVPDEEAEDGSSFAQERRASVLDVLLGVGGATQ